MLVQLQHDVYLVVESDNVFLLHVGSAHDFDSSELLQGRLLVHDVVFVDALAHLSISTFTECGVQDSVEVSHLAVVSGSEPRSLTVNELLHKVLVELRLQLLLLFILHIFFKL